jgi:hypothetical protein
VRIPVPQETLEEFVFLTSLTLGLVQVTFQLLWPIFFFSRWGLSM